MEPTLNYLDILVELWIISNVGIFYTDLQIVSIIAEVFRRFNFFNESGLLQFWACSTPSNSEDIRCNITLTDRPFVSTGDHIALKDHRRRCFVNDNRFVGLETRAGNWFAGRAAQTRIADYRTRHFVLSQDPRAEVVGRQLVLPFFQGRGAWKKLVGIIEFVTIAPKGSHSEDFKLLCQLLQALGPYGLQSNYMGKMIKVKYMDDLIKFPLPYSSKLADLQREVTERFNELGQRNLRIYYEHANGNRYPISSDADVQRVMAESNSRGEKVIRMCVEKGNVITDNVRGFIC